MRTPLVILITILFFVTACGTSTSAPDYDEDTLVETLARLHIADSRLLLDPTSPDSLRSLILSEQGYSEEQFERVITYLSQNPDRLTEVYTRVVDRIVQDSEKPVSSQ